jgi:4-hydroxy 2-oxovalerate aldolase
MIIDGTDKHINLLDCTLRDGGYHVNWDFDLEFLDNYIRALAESDVDIIEIGYRSNTTNTYKGVFAYSPDYIIDYISERSPDFQLAIMVNESEYRHVSGIEKFNKIISTPSMKKVHIIRIATDVDCIENSLKLAEKAKDAGYIVATNIMKCGILSNVEILKCAKKISEYSSVVDVIYIADSLGSMTPTALYNSINAIKQHWNGEIGFHSHNNNKLSLANALIAVNTGVVWVDSTVSGLGRGAGNLATEDVLIFFKNTDSLPISDSLLLFIENDIEHLRSKFKWGTNIFYQLAAKKLLHPSYAQKVVESSSMNSISKNLMISQLDNKSYIFSDDMINNARDEFLSYDGTWDATDWCKGRRVLIVASGESAISNNLYIEQYINRYSPIVLALGVEMDDKYIDYYAVLSKEKFLNNRQEYLSTRKTVITPKGLFAEGEFLNNIKYYGVKVIDQEFSVDNMMCTLPYNNVLSFAVALSIIGGASLIKCAGVDGNSTHKYTNYEVNDFFNMLYKKYPEIDISSITPTSYNIKSASWLSEIL